ncbi:hypothetical protein MHU86_12245 [Fragilaria crotonensis]|nr:hypothetical protein MHU86_12245 [Fragilaria crotonensis]
MGFTSPRLIHSLLLLFLVNVLCKCCLALWSPFGGRRSSHQLPPRSTQNLIEHLVRGPSRVDKGVSVVVVSRNECGIQLERSCATSTATIDVHHHYHAHNNVDSELAFVDRTEFVTPQCGLETPTGRAVQEYFARHDTTRASHGGNCRPCTLPSFESDKAKETVWRSSPYLQTLPSLEGLKHLPVFWDALLLEELQNSVVKEAVQNRRKEWEDEHKIVLAAIREAGGTSTEFVSLETWYWARSVITSRAFTDHASGEICLVPFIDMLNHISASQAVSQRDVVKCNWEIDSSGFHLLMPDDARIKDVDAKQIEISYGDHSNSNFLMNYGFSILDDSQHACENKAKLSLSLVVRHDVDQKDIEILWEADGLGDCHDVTRDVTVCVGNPGPIQSALSLCRVASAHDSELNAMKSLFLKKGEETTQTDDGLVPQMGATLSRSPFSVPNEIRAMERLQRAANDDLGKYKTTLEEDDILLHRGFSRRRRWFGRHRDFQRLRNAIIVRRGESKSSATFIIWRHWPCVFENIRP